MAAPHRQPEIYGRDFSLAYHRAFSASALLSARGILRLLRPTQKAGGLVLELGCGDGLLAGKLIAAGHKVIATDASPAMLELARPQLTGAVSTQLLTLPDDPLPEADAIVSVGHVLTYLPDQGAIGRALVAIARAVRPGGLFALDFADLAYGQSQFPASGRAGDDWAVVTSYAKLPANRLVRNISTFVANDDGSWRRADERHEHLLIDLDQVAACLRAENIELTLASGFGGERLPPGLGVMIGRRPDAAAMAPVSDAATDRASR